MTLALAGLVMLLHTSLLPAGAGAVAGLVVVSRAPATAPVEAAPAKYSPARVLWLVAVIATVASGIVHAAAGPGHAAENPLFGIFFFGAACVQFLWCMLAVLSPSRSLLRWGALVNLGLILLWVLTRTVGLPGLLEGPEEVGAWDLASKVWELVALGCCALLLRRSMPRLPGQMGQVGLDGSITRRTGYWLVYSFLSVSAAALLVLAMSGPPE